MRHLPLNLTTTRLGNESEAVIRPCSRQSIWILESCMMEPSSRCISARDFSAYGPSNWKTMVRDSDLSCDFPEAPATNSANAIPYATTERMAFYKAYRHVCAI